MSISASAQYTGPELCRLQAFEVVELLAKKEISPQDLLDACFKRMEQVEPHINATPTICPDRAYLAAQELSDKAVAPAANLHGLPISIKDLTAVANVRTTFATEGFTDFIPQTSDFVVERLEKRGGIVVGKTNTPEFGAGGNTFNSVFGATLNPWDTKLNAGGSSGGAAAALATGEIWLSHGSDSAGSLRTPAAYCGIVGLRPSPGRVPYGPRQASFMMEGVDGPMARSVRDCALFLDAMVDFDPRCPLSFPSTGTSFQDAVIQADGRVRIAFSPDLNGLSVVEANVADHLAKALALVERNGSVVDLVFPALPHLVRTYEVFRGLSWVAATKRLGSDVKDRFRRDLKKNIEFGEKLTAGEIAEAHLNRSVIYANMVSLLEDFDVIACPVVGCMPHLQSEPWPRYVGDIPLESYLDWLRFSFLATVTGLPAISVPVGLNSDGLPVGVQLIGRPRGEAKLLSAARAVEVAVGWKMTPIDPR